MGGTASSTGFSIVLSWTFAAVSSTASGMPPASTRTCRLLPGLPRSVGFGPVSSTLFLPVPRPTVLRDTALQVEDCKEVQDGRGRWDGRGPVGARPPRWRRRVHARAPTADVGAPQAGRGAEAVGGRG